MPTIHDSTTSDLERRVDTMPNRTPNQQAAYILGKRRASDEATWYIDGNSKTEDVRALLKGIQDGDPMVTDDIGQAPLSHEWAGDYSLTNLADNFNIDQEVESELELLDTLAGEYEAGYWENIQQAVEAECERWLA